MITQILDRMIFEKNVLQSLIKGTERLKREEPKTEPIHVIMNGPSLKDSIFFVKSHPGKILMANKMICYLDNYDMTPDYYCLADPHFVESPVEDSVKAVDLLREYKENLVLFVTSGFPKIFLKQFKCETRIVNATQLPQYYSTSFMVKELTKNSASPCFINVAVLGVYVALQLGYKKIYLHGCDMNGIRTAQVNIDNQWGFCDEHVYNEGEEPVKLLEELNGQKYTLEYSLECDVLAYKNLRILRRYADECGADIVNMSPNSWVECFRKYHMEDC